jgi:steroid 5-alpha reductase family enzyme
VVFASAVASYALRESGSSPLDSAWHMAGANACLCLVGSLLTGEYSWVDRLWSVTPALYAAHFASRPGAGPRLVLMAILVTLWATRLTYNFARKAGYTVGEQDYRWPELQRLLRLRTGDGWRFLACWQAFNVLFIATYQNALLLLITLPCVHALSSDAPLGWTDAAATALFMASLALETVADEQQWQFQRGKRGLLPQRPAWRADYARGFLTQGTFRYSRHPNFFAEQAIWWSFALFGLACGSGWHSSIGALLLSGIFMGSTPFTEAITAAKYPCYAEYCARTSRLIPLPPSY